MVVITHAEVLGQDGYGERLIAPLGVHRDAPGEGRDRARAVAVLRLEDVRSATVVHERKVSTGARRQDYIHAFWRVSVSDGWRQRDADGGGCSNNEQGAWNKLGRCHAQDCKRAAAVKPWLLLTMHANALLTPRGRLALAHCVVDDGWALGRAAERFQCSAQTAARWAKRYRDRDLERPAIEAMVDRFGLTGPVLPAAQPAARRARPPSSTT